MITLFNFQTATQRPAPHDLTKSMSIIMLPQYIPCISYSPSAAGPAG